MRIILLIILLIISISKILLKGRPLISKFDIFFNICLKQSDEIISSIISKIVRIGSLFILQV